MKLDMRIALNIERFGCINIRAANGINLQGHEFHYSGNFENNKVSRKTVRLFFIIFTRIMGKNGNVDI